MKPEYNEIMISIILPVHNGGKYISFCIESILNQSYRNFELIIINDGSTDNTADIINSYAAKDNRIRSFLKINQGVSTARNVGIEKSKGKYLYFIDADDILIENALELLLSTMIKYSATLTRADFKTIDEDGKDLYINKKFFLRKKQNMNILSANDFYKYVFMDEYFLWLCLFRKDIIDIFDIRFIKGCKFMEDADFIMRYMINSDKNVYINRYIYKYRKTITSATGRKNNYYNDIQLIVNSLSPFSKNLFINTFLTKLKKRPNKFKDIVKKIILNIRYNYTK